MAYLLFPQNPPEVGIGIPYVLPVGFCKLVDTGTRFLNTFNKGKAFPPAFNIGTNAVEHREDTIQIVRLTLVFMSLVQNRSVCVRLEASRLSLLARRPGVGSVETDQGWVADGQPAAGTGRTPAPTAGEQRRANGLLQKARAEAALKHAAEARKIYQQIQNLYPNTLAAQQARRALAALDGDDP